MDDLLIHCLQDLYSAETQALDAMPELMERVQDPKLRKAFEKHIKETEEQVKRLEQACQEIGCDAEGETCMGIQGIIEEAQDTLDQLEGESIADAAIIGAAQKMEHYEIASYGTARAVAQQTGQKKIVTLLEKTLKEEKAADEKLTELAEAGLNERVTK